MSAQHNNAIAVPDGRNESRAPERTDRCLGGGAEAEAVSARASRQLCELGWDAASEAPASRLAGEQTALRGQVTGGLSIK